MATILEDLADRGGELALRTLTAVFVASVVAVVGRLVRPIVRHLLDRADRPSRTRVFLGLYRVVVAVFAFLLAMTLAFPSVEVVDVLASLGVVSIAIGFAFKDSLENLLAGVLLLWRDPFRSGDQIRVGEYAGTVERLTVRETLLRTFDGELVLVPNADVSGNALTVATHYPLARVTTRVRIDPAADVGRARDALLPVLRRASQPGAPDPEVVVSGMSDGALDLDLRFWTRSPRASRTAALDAALPAAVQALGAAGVGLDDGSVVLKGSP